MLSLPQSKFGCLLEQSAVPPEQWNMSPPSQREGLGNTNLLLSAALCSQIRHHRGSSTWLGYKKKEEKKKESKNKQTKKPPNC